MHGVNLTQLTSGITLTPEVDEVSCQLDQGKQ